MSEYKELFLTTTDTVTGIGAPMSQKNKEAIFRIKGRPTNKSLVIMVASLEEAKKLKGWNAKATKLAELYWPGDTTLIVSDKLAVRVPDNENLQELLKKLGPCYMTSANYSGGEPLPLDEARNVFQEIGVFYDFGKGSGHSSKLIDVNTDEEIKR